MVEYKGYWLPQVYSSNGALEEYWACRQAAVVLDLSPLRKWEVTGPDAEALMQWVLTRDVKKLSQGQVVYSAMCYDHGGMIDDGTVIPAGPRSTSAGSAGMTTAGSGSGSRLRSWGLKAMVRSSTDQLHNLAVQGPNSPRDHQADDLDRAAPADDGGAGLVPLHGGPSGRAFGCSRRGVADRLYGRAGV